MVLDDPVSASLKERTRVLDFIERHFGISPDGGDGSVKAALIVFLFIAIAVTAMRLPGYRKY